MDSCSALRRDPVEMLLRRIALGALRGSLLLAGCADEDILWPAGNQQPVGEELDPCEGSAGGYPVQASGLRLAQPADYLAVREARGFERDPIGRDEWTLTTFVTSSESGTRCATATTSACASKVAKDPAAPVQQSCGKGACSETSIVTTRGDDVQRWATPSELGQQLGAIDSADDAMLLATSHGYEVSCVSPDSLLAAWRASCARTERPTP